MEGFEIEHLRRSLAMLPSESAGLSREEAIRLLAELQDMDRGFRDLRDGPTAPLERGSTEG